jgi:membrane-associated phospholipid phosphatase
MLPLKGRPLRLLAWGAVGAGIAVPFLRRRLRIPAPATAAVVAAAPFGLAIAVPRTRKRDVGVYVLQMWAYTIVHELPNDRPERLERRVHVEYPIAVDRALFGSPPTVVLQRVLAHPDRPRPLDYALVFLHWAWFLQPHASVAWVLWRHPDSFPRAAARLCAVFDIGLIGYILVPTAPPWWAAEHDPRGRGMRRIMVEVGERVWGGLWPALYRVLGGNPLAAMPSLHFGTSVMAAHLLDDFGPIPAALGWGYASVLGFALVYLGEHYVVDLAAGLALAEGVRAGAPLAAPLAGRVGRVVQALEAQARA